jgi:hypothetical protein
MTMPTPPPDTRAPGQTGHIADHNTISDALTALEGAVGTLQETVANTSLSLPLTTLGDTLFENSASALARLPGNATTTRMFMRQQGTGSGSAAPAWDTLEAGDLPAATTGAQGAVQLAGDLGGAAAAPEVLKIQGTAIAAPPGGTTGFLRGDGNWASPAGSATASVFGRTGAVAAQSGDYTVGQVTGAAPLANPTFSGVPAAPTASVGTSTTQIATTAFVVAEIGSVSNAATATNLAGGATLPAYLAPAIVPLSQSGATVAVNAALGNAFNLAVAGSWTISNPVSPHDGQVIRFRLTSGGAHTTSWGTAYDFGSGSAPALSQTSGKLDICAFEYAASIGKWCYLGSGIGF